MDAADVAAPPDTGESRANAASRIEEPSVRTVAIVNQKGGSGKTTTALNLGAALARAGQRTLIVDLDPQSHCALGLAIPEAQIDLHVGDAMLAHDARPLERERMLWPVGKNLDLLPSTTRLAALEAARGGLADREDRDIRLALALTRLAEDYDWCLVDCPPFIGLLTFNALRAASEVLIPVETGFFALQGATKQVSTIQAVARKFGVGIPYRILPTLHNPESSLARDILAELEKRFEGKLVPVTIRQDTRLREAASTGVPVNELDAQCVGASDYAELAAYLVSAPAPIAEIPEPLAVPTFGQDGRPVAPGAGMPGDENAMPRPLTAGPDQIIEPTLVVGGRPVMPIGRSSSTASRAAELADRARRLAARHADLHARLRTDDEVASLLGDTHNDSSPSGPTFDERAAMLMEPSASVPSRPLGATVTPQGVLFVHPASPGSRIAVAGDHNGWSGTATPLRYNAVAGVHEALVPLSPGKHRYRLVIDGSWITDPFNPVSESNPFGARDSIVVVPAISASGALAPARSA